MTATERVTPGVPSKAINYALMEENRELRERIKELESQNYSSIPATVCIGSIPYITKTITKTVTK